MSSTRSLALAVLCLTPSARAITYDLTADFSIAANPNGVWSYGYRTAIADTALTLYTQTGQFVGVTGKIDNWRTATYDYLSWGKNLGATPFDGGEDTHCPPGEILAHPGPGVVTVARFTAPTPAVYTVSAAVSRFGGPRDGVSRFTLVRAGVTVYDETVSQPYTFQPAQVHLVELPAGGVLDFVVDMSDAVEFHDSTGVHATLVPSLPGDANLDGIVNADDLARIDRGHAIHLTGWSNGDFDVDGAVTAADYAIIDAALGAPAPPIVSVPEPASAGLITAAALVRLASRRPRR